ncbi:MFS transporter [Desulfovirgula thermocuniculi]|uniref:MFS transporter n=1 Tax=Desulfovirgula thermocuniculi TaxID=348842 RepID=UPI00040AE7E0|nr:MFS transporter [Desulfovirgula thermocuniculi]
MERAKIAAGEKSIPVAALSFIQLLVLLPAYCLPAVLPVVEKEWGISHASAGMMVAAFQAGYIAAALVALPLTDRYDARYALAGGAVLSAAAHFLFPLLARDLVSGTLLRALAGAGLGGIYMPGIKIISLAPARRGRAVGIYVSSYLLGTSLSFALTGALTALWPWRPVYLSLAAAGIPAAALSLLLWRRPGEVFAPIPPRSPAAHVPPVPPHAPAAVLIIFAYAAHMWEMYGLRSWLSPFLTAVLQERAARANSLAASLTALSVLLGAPSTALAGWISDRLGRAVTAAALLCASAACSLVFGWLYGGPLWLLLAVGALYSLVVTADSPVFSTALAEVSPRERLGRLMAWQTLAGYLLATAAPPAFGLLLDLFPGPRGWAAAFSSLGLVALVGAGFMIYLHRREQKGRPALKAGSPTNPAPRQTGNFGRDPSCPPTCTPLKSSQVREHQESHAGDHPDRRKNAGD